MNYWTSAVFAVAIVLAFILGRDQIWALFGPADLGSISLERLQRRATPNDALACPPGICAAKSDIEPLVYAVNVADLRDAFAKVIASEPRVTRVDSNDSEPSERYIQRSLLMGFPDTIVVRYFDRQASRSTLALYSRSQLGKGDFGVNRARIKRWMEKLAALVPIAK